MKPEDIKMFKKILDIQISLLFLITIVCIFTGFYPAFFEGLFFYSIGGFLKIKKESFKSTLIFAISVGLFGGFFDPIIAPYVPFVVPTNLFFSLFSNFLFGTFSIILGWFILKYIIEGKFG